MQLPSVPGGLYLLDNMEYTFKLYCNMWVYRLMSSPFWFFAGDV